MVMELIGGFALMMNCAMWRGLLWGMECLQQNLLKFVKVNLKRANQRMFEMDKPMTFNEWLGTQGNMVLLHANCCRIAYEAGQQSQQAKVEELQKRVDRALESIREICDTNCNLATDDYYYLIEDLLGILDGKIVAELEQALKGEG